jgi:hypothetical protein
VKERGKQLKSLVRQVHALERVDASSGRKATASNADVKVLSYVVTGTWEEDN